MSTRVRASLAVRASSSATIRLVRLVALLVAAMLVMQLTPASPASAADEATLTQDVTPEDPPYNGNLAVSTVAPFDVDGGTAAFRPGTTAEEEFTYTGVDAETLILTGIRREAPESHPNGSAVAPVEASPTSSPSPGGEAASPSPSPATDDAGAAASPSTGTDETSSEAASADIGTDDSSASSVGEITPLCEILGTCEIDPDVGCQGCDELVDQLVGLIETCQLSDCIAPVNDLIARICGGTDVFGCQTKLSEVLAAAIGEVCPSGLTTCADPTINMISRLVMDTVCPSGSIGYCAGEIARQVNEKVAFAVGVARELVVLACTGDTAGHCIQTVQALLDAWVFQTVCGSSNLFTCANNLADKVNDLVVNACNLEKSATSPTYDSATTACVNKIYETVQVVLGVVNDTMIIACQSSETNTCAANLIQKVNDAVSTACSFVPGTSVTPGATRCVERILQLVDTVVGIAQQEVTDTCGSPDPRRCVEMATAEAFKALDAVNDTVANTCNQQIGAATSTTESAATACVNRVLATVAAIQQLVAQTMIERCGSSDPNACTANLIARINVEVNRICASIPGDRNTTGVNECIDKTWQIVNTGVEAGKQRMREACGSDIATVCANNVVNQLLFLIDRVNDLVANTCGGQTAGSTSTADSAASECTERVLSTLAFVYSTACGSGDALTCAGGVLAEIEAAIAVACVALPSADSAEAGSEDCGAKIIGMINHVMVQACGSSEAAACIESATGAVAQAIAEANSAICGDTDTSGCQAKYVEAINEVFIAICGASTAPAETCTNVVTALTKSAIAQLYDKACASAATNACVMQYHGLVVGFVDATLMAICGPGVGPGAASCLDLAGDVILEAASTVYGSSCGDGGDAAECAAGYGKWVATLIAASANTIFDEACAGAEDIPGCVSRIQPELSAIVDDLAEAAFDVICPDDADVSTCIGPYLAAVRAAMDGLINLADEGVQQGDDAIAPLTAEAGRVVYEAAVTLQSLLAAALARCGDSDLVVVPECYGIDQTDGPTTFTIHGPSGTPLGNAAVAIYLIPYDTPCVFQPPLLARTVTDESGTVAFDPVLSILGSSAPPELLPDIGQERVINIEILAVDAEHTSMLNWNSVVPLYEPYQEDVATNVDLSAGGPLPDSVTDDDLIGIVKVEAVGEPAGEAEGPTPAPALPAEEGDDTTRTAPVSGGRVPDAVELCFAGASAKDAARDADGDPVSPSPTTTPGSSPPPTSEPSSAPNPTPTPPSPPIAPTDLTASAASGTEVRLSWKDNSVNEEWFELERWNGSSWSLVARVGPGTAAYSEGGMSPGTTYEYRVRAGNSGGVSGYSNSATATTLASNPKGTPPAPPSTLSAHATSTSEIALQWTDSSANEAGFRIQRTTGDHWVHVATIPAGSTAYSDAGLQGGTTYSYRVSAYNSAGESGYSNAATTRTHSPSGQASPTPTPRDASNYDYSDDDDVTAEECWDPCNVEERIRWMKVSQQHADIGLDSEFELKNGRETVAGVGFKLQGQNWTASGTSIEAVVRGTFAAKGLSGNAKHRVVQAKYKWVRWKYTTHCDADGIQRCHYYKWKNHRWEDELRFADEHPGAADFEKNRENAVAIHKGEKWGRYGGENKTFEAGVDIGPLTLKTRAGFSAISSVTFIAKGECDARNKTRYAYGDGVHARDAKVIYALSYCIP